MLIFLIASNVYIFVSGFTISEKISYYEQEIKKLHQQNIDLEQKAYKVNSLQHTASEAATLGFDKRTEPIYLDELHFAKKE